MTDYLAPIVALIIQTSSPGQSLCQLFPQPLSTAGQVTFTFTLAGLPSPSNVSITVTGPTGFISSPSSASCSAGVCSWTPQHPWQTGSYQWTARSLDPVEGCAGVPSAPASFTIP